MTWDCVFHMGLFRCVSHVYLSIVGCFGLDLKVFKNYVLNRTTCVGSCMQVLSLESIMHSCMKWNNNFGLCIHQRSTRDVMVISVWFHYMLSTGCCILIRKLAHARTNILMPWHKHINAMVFRSGNRVGLAFAHALICHGMRLCLPYRHTDRAHHEPDDTASMIHMHGSNLAASIPLSVVYPASHASTCSSSPVRSMLQSLDDAFHLLHRKSKHITIHYSWACLQATWAQDHTQIRSVGYLSCDNEGLGGAAARTPWRKEPQCEYQVSWLWALNLCWCWSRSKREFASTVIHGKRNDDAREGAIVVGRHWIVSQVEVWAWSVVINKGCVSFLGDRVEFTGHRLQQGSGKFGGCQNW